MMLELNLMWVGFGLFHVQKAYPLGGGGGDVSRVSYLLFHQQTFLLTMMNPLLVPFPSQQLTRQQSTWQVDCCVPCVTKFQSVIFYSIQLNVHFVHESLPSSLQHFFGGRTWQKKEESGGIVTHTKDLFGKKIFWGIFFEIARFKLWVLTSSYMSQNNNRVPKKF